MLQKPGCHSVTDAKIQVVKIGGSLLASPKLGNWLGRLVACGGGRVIAVPGGGPFADQVRRTQASLHFDDNTAHAMALLAMDQCGRLCCGIEPGLARVETREEMHAVLACNKVALWLPARMLLNHPAIPASWDMTSDSIAAWLAREMGANHLLLVKYQSVSAEHPSLEELQASGIVDNGFADMVSNADFAWSILGKNDYARFSVAD